MRACSRLLVCLLAAAFGAGCATHTTDARLGQLEAQSQNMHVLDLRVAHVEERLTRVESAVGDLREGWEPTAGGKKVPPLAPVRAKAYAVPAPSPAPQSPAAPRPVAPLPSASASAPSFAPSLTAPAPPALQAAQSAPAVPDSGPGLTPIVLAASSPGGAQVRPVAGRAPAAPATSSSREAGPAAPRSGSAAYDAALALYYKGEYAKAGEGFAAFLAQNPKSALAANALYWEGECRYSTGKYDAAILLFKDVAAKYPKHPKAAAALLKAGYAYAKLNDMENAKFYWQILLDDFPGSKPAALARKRMAEG